jgi:hypothetical protein
MNYSLVENFGPALPEILQFHRVVLTELLPIRSRSTPLTPLTWNILLRGSQLFADRRDQAPING